MLRRLIQKMIRTLRKKIDLSFLNPSGILIVIVSVFAVLYLVNINRITRRSKPILTDGTYYDLKYIKPFTSLVVFNRRLQKEKQRMIKGEKPAAFLFPLLQYKKDI
jgi:hypothetical protein